MTERKATASGISRLTGLAGDIRGGTTGGGLAGGRRGCVGLGGAGRVGGGCLDDHGAVGGAERDLFFVEG